MAGSLLQKTLLNIIGKTETWARILLSVLFVLGGASFSHGNEFHHHADDRGVNHHADGGSAAAKFTPHEHFEPTNIDADENVTGIHCGAPELQPVNFLLLISSIIAETIKPVSAPLLAENSLGFEPPPPRT